MIAQHSIFTDEARELTALYSLGALPTAEHAEFEEHLRLGCQACHDELESLQTTVGMLGFAAQTVAPPAALRQRLLERVRETPSAAAGILFNRAGLLISRSADLPWQAAPLVGIWSKPLFVDVAGKYTTALVRMDPGTRYPSHRHHEVEELFMI